MLALYLGKRIELGYNNKLMKCCVNIIYTIVISIYILLSTDRLFRFITTLQCG